MNRLAKVFCCVIVARFRLYCECHVQECSMCPLVALNFPTFSSLDGIKESCKWRKQIWFAWFKVRKATYPHNHTFRIKRAAEALVGIQFDKNCRRPSLNFSRVNFVGFWTKKKPGVLKVKMHVKSIMEIGLQFSKGIPFSMLLEKSLFWSQIPCCIASAHSCGKKSVPNINILSRNLSAWTSLTALPLFLEAHGGQYSILTPSTHSKLNLILHCISLLHLLETLVAIFLWGALILPYNLCLLQIPDLGHQRSICHIWLYNHRWKPSRRKHVQKRELS